MTRCWMVRSGGGGRLYDYFQEHSLVAIGWSEVGDLNQISGREQIFLKLKNVFSTEKDLSLRVAAGQLFRFKNEFKIGDRIVTYDPGSRRYNCGKITGPYQFVEGAADEYLMNQRQVIWEHETLRDDISQTARNTLGATLTIFQIGPEIQSELWNEKTSDEKTPTPPLPPSEVVDLSFRSIQEKAIEAIKDMLVALDPYDMQELIAGLLRAMGYKTVVSPRGSDLGKDIVASPDGLGLQEPRIYVEVKHRPRQRMGTQDVRSFIGGRRTGDRGLYVSTGGFTKEAHYEGERAGIAMTLIDFERLTELVLEHYDRFDAESRQLVPLKAIYWPVRT